MLESFCPIINSFQNITNVDKSRPPVLESDYCSPFKQELGLKRKLDLIPSVKYNLKEAVENVDYEETIFNLGVQLFNGIVFFLDNLSKKDSQLILEITENGGKLSTNINPKVNLCIFNSDLTKNAKDSKLKSAVKLGIPAVTKQYVENCVKEKTLLETSSFLVSNHIKANSFKNGVINIINEVKTDHPGTSSFKKRNVKLNVVTVHYEPDSLRDFILLKYIQLKGKTISLNNEHNNTSSTYQFYVLELHASITKYYDEPTQFCIFTHEGEIKDVTSGKSEGKKLCRFLSTLSDAIETYSLLLKKITGASKYLSYTQEFLSPKLGSPSFQNIQKEYHNNITTIKPTVVQVVDLIWNEAVSCLSNVLVDEPVNIPSWKINEATKIILQIVFVITDGKDKKVLSRLWNEFYNVLKCKPTHMSEFISPSHLNEKFNLCNTLRDLVNVIESCPTDIKHDPEARCRSLRCNINHFGADSDEFEEISNLIMDSQTVDTKIIICNIFSVCRSSDSVLFHSDIGNKKMLFHGTSPGKLMGIISRGLDVSNSLKVQLDSEKLLGSGIYFTDSSSFAAKYCESTSKGSRIMVISEVALGNIYKTQKPESDLTSAPAGYHSVLGLNSEKGSIFSENEYVVYNSNQCRICYLVEYSFPEDTIQDYPFKNVLKKLQNKFIDEDHTEYTYNVDNIHFNDELKIDDSFGLECLDKSLNNSLSLKAIHVRAQIVDFVSRVHLFQVYQNSSDKNLEVKYIFPLDSGAAICGFEAFIGNKHIVGEVKEKETARTEYEAAKKEGHGAYLLEESSRNVFTIHVGNIPPFTTTVVKLIFLSELAAEQDCIKFVLPNLCKMSSVTNSDNYKPDFSFEACLEMATEILSISSPTHKIIRKKTDTKAVVKLIQSTEREPFSDLILSIRIVNIHVPRMWIEKHPDRDTRACMVTFYPEFNIQDSASQESTGAITFLLDTSDSMRGSDFQNLINISLMALELIKYNQTFNIVAFGTIYRELFPTAQRFTMEHHQKAKDFIAELRPCLGRANLSHLLRNCQLLSQNGKIMDMFLISNGIRDSESNLLKMELSRLRIFSFGIGEANQHLLHLISRNTGGSYTNYKKVEINKWRIKIQNQVKKSNQPSLLDIHVEWQNEDHVLQAPKTIYSIFNNFSQIIFALNTFCTLATLKARIGQQEVSTVVFTHELSQTTGSMIHSLAAKAYIQDWEDGILDNDETLHKISKEDDKMLVTSFAKEHSLVTSLTSFLAIEKRSSSQEKPLQEVPVEDLLKNVDVDILKYMEFTNLELNDGSTSTANEQIDISSIQFSQPIKKIKKQAARKKKMHTEMSSTANASYAHEHDRETEQLSSILESANFPPLPDKRAGNTNKIATAPFNSSLKTSNSLVRLQSSPFSPASQPSFGSSHLGRASQPPCSPFGSTIKSIPEIWDFSNESAPVAESQQLSGSLFRSVSTAKQTHSVFSSVLASQPSVSALGSAIKPCGNPFGAAPSTPQQQNGALRSAYFSKQAKPIGFSSKSSQPPGFSFGSAAQSPCGLSFGAAPPPPSQPSGSLFASAVPKNCSFSFGAAEPTPSQISNSLFGSQQTSLARMSKPAIGPTSFASPAFVSDSPLKSDTGTLMLKQRMMKAQAVDLTSKTSSAIFQGSTEKPKEHAQTDYETNESDPISPSGTKRTICLPAFGATPLNDILEQRAGILHKTSGLKSNLEMKRESKQQKELPAEKDMVKSQSAPNESQKDWQHRCYENDIHLDKLIDICDESSDINMDDISPDRSDISSDRSDISFDRSIFSSQFNYIQKKGRKSCPVNKPLSPEFFVDSLWTNDKIELDMINKRKKSNVLCKKVQRQLSKVEETPLVLDYLIEKKASSPEHFKKAVQFVDTYLMSKGGSFPMLNSITNCARDEIVKQGYNRKEIMDDLNLKLNEMKDKAKLQEPLIDEEVECRNKICFCTSFYAMENELLNNGLKSLGLKIAGEVLEMVRYVAVLQINLIAILEKINYANPEISMEDHSSFDHIIKGISFLLMENDLDTCVPEEFGILCHNYINYFDKAYPLLYATLTMEKSWESFVFSHLMKNVLA